MRLHACLRHDVTVPIARTGVCTHYVKPLCCGLRRNGPPGAPNRDIKDLASNLASTFRSKRIRTRAGLDMKAVLPVSLRCFVSPHGIPPLGQIPPC